MSKGSDDTAKDDDSGRHGGDDPADHDAGDDKGGDRPDGVSDDDPATHDVGDDKGGDRLDLVFNARSGQWIFTDDDTERSHWLDDHGRPGGEWRLPSAATGGDGLAAVWRFHDPASDVYFWTADEKLEDALLRDHPEVEFEGEVFKAYTDDGAGDRTAIGVVWDQDAGPYGSFTYLPADEAVALAGLSDSDALVFLGVSFYL